VASSGNQRPRPTVLVLTNQSPPCAARYRASFAGARGSSSLAESTTTQSSLVRGRAGLVITGGKYNHPKQSRLRARGARHYWRKVQPPKAVSFAGARGSFGRICGARLPRHALLKGSEGYAFRFDSVFLTVEPMAKPTVAFSYFFSF